MLQPYNMPVAYKPITTLRRLLTNVKDKYILEDRQEAIYKIKHWDSATFITYSTDYYQRLTLESWFTNLEQKPLNRSQLPAPYKRLIDEIKENQLRENDWTTDNLSNNRRLFNCNNRWIEAHQLHYDSS